MSRETPQYANFTWPSRWSKSQGAVAALSQAGADVMATGFFGVLNFRLDQPEDVAAIVKHARAFADMVESAGRAFAGLCHRCGEQPVARYTSEICETCDPVGLCRGCFDTHAAEVAADKADGLHP